MNCVFPPFQNKSWCITKFMFPKKLIFYMQKDCFANQNRIRREGHVDQFCTWCRTILLNLVKLRNFSSLFISQSPCNFVIVFFFLSLLKPKRLIIALCSFQTYPESPSTGNVWFGNPRLPSTHTQLSIVFLVFLSKF